MKSFRRKRKQTSPEDQRIFMEGGRRTAAPAYADLEEERFQISSERSRVVMCGIMMGVVFLLSFFFVSDLTNTEFSLATFGHSFMRRFNDLFDVITGNPSQSGIINFLCTFLTALLCGIALASSSLDWL